MKIEDIPQTTIGVDLGDSKHHFCVIDQAGNRIEKGKLVNQVESLSLLASKYPGARVAMEVGTHSPWVSRHFAAAGCEVLVGNARKLRAIYENERKCDELDAEMLAKIARLDPKLLKPVTHVSEEAMRDRLVLGTREQLVEHRKALVQSVRSSVKSLGRRIASSSVKVFPKRVREELEDDVKLLELLDPMLEAIAKMSESIRKLDEKIEQLSTEKYQITQTFRQICGVGPTTSLAFTLTVEDPNRIDKTRDVGAYLGIVPRRDQSGNSDKSLGISKTGNAYLRKLLVQCAQYILGPHGPDCDLRQFGMRLAERGGKAHKKKAIVAVARKLAVLMLSLWKSGEDYEPSRKAAMNLAD